MKARKIVLSCFALVNILFVPVFDVWGGLFPSNPDDNFFDAIKYALDGDFDYWIVLFSFAIFLPSLFMFIFSFIESNKPFKIFSGIGCVSLLFLFYNFISQNDIEEAFDSDDGSICIGFWIALTLFIVSFFVVKFRNNKAVETSPNPNTGSNKSIENNTTNIYQNNLSQQDNLSKTDYATAAGFSQNSIQKTKKFCGKCGSPIDATSEFCGNCGWRIL